MIPVQPPARNADESARTKTRNSRGIADREADTMDERKRDETIAGQVAEARWKTLPLHFERQRNRGRETKRKIWRGRERETKIGKHSRWRESFSRCFSRGCIGCGGLQPALEGLCTVGRGDGKEDGGWRGSFCRRQRWCGLSLLPLSYSSLPVSLLPSLIPPYFPSVHIFTWTHRAPSPSTRALASFFTPSVFPALSRHPSHPLLPPPSTPTSEDREGGEGWGGGGGGWPKPKGGCGTRNAWLATLLDAPDESVRPGVDDDAARATLIPLFPRRRPEKRDERRQEWGSRVMRRKDGAHSEISRARYAREKGIVAKKRRNFRVRRAHTPPWYHPTANGGLTPRLASRRRKATSFDQLQPPVFPFVALLFVFFNTTFFFSF